MVPAICGAVTGATLKNTAVSVTVATAEADSPFVVPNAVYGEWTSRRQALHEGPTKFESSDTQDCIIPETGLGVKVDAFHEAVKLKMGREESSIVVFEIRIHVQLQSGYSVREV